jgi:hypothetical protein
MMRWSAIALGLVLAVVSGCGDDAVTDPQGPPTAGLLAFFPFAGTAADQSGHGNDGSLLGGATAVDYLNTRANDLDALSLPHTLVDGLTDFTIAAWVRISILQIGTNQFLSGANATEDNALGFWYANPEDRWNIRIDGVTYNYDGASTEDGQWHHVAFVREAAASTFHMDGSAVGSSIPVPGTAIAVDSGGLIIGQDQDGVGGSFDATQAWAGQVDNLRFYDRALTPDEIDLLVNESQ